MILLSLLSSTFALHAAVFFIFLTFSFQEGGDSFCSVLGGSEVAEAGWIHSSEAELAWKKSEYFRRPLNHLKDKGIAQSSPRKT